MSTVIDDHSEEVGLRERKKLQTRQAIHEAAYRLVDEYGLEATTIDQICNEAEVSSRTFFNYYPSKAAAALQLSGTAIPDEVRDRFRVASGGLVSALCEVVGSSAELGRGHTKMKQLITRHPDLLTTASQLMTEARGQLISLAAERAADREQAALAVTLVMAALGRILHDDASPSAPLADQLRDTVSRILAVTSQELRPIQA
jgi:AcrR family transcriptional regulator